MTDDRLGALLSAYRVAPPDAALQAAVLMAAHAAPPRAIRLRWWQGLALGGAGFAGAVAGAAAMASVTTPPPAVQLRQAGEGTIFGDPMAEGQAE